VADSATAQCAVRGRRRPSAACRSRSMNGITRPAFRPRRTMSSPGLSFVVLASAAVTASARNASHNYRLR
jgi:hypothetical protein